MKKTILLLKIITIYFLITSDSLAVKNNYFEKGKNLFKKSDFENSKIFFERDLVFNPKNENSYLYLAKIFNKRENEDEEEMKLENVLLINPQNDEALYMLIMLKIKQSNYKEAKVLMGKFDLVCKEFCSKKSEIKKKFNKLIPSDEKQKD